MSNEIGAAVASWLTRYPIFRHGQGYPLTDRKGNRISFHRTISGALREPGRESPHTQHNAHS